MDSSRFDAGLPSGYWRRPIGFRFEPGEGKRVDLIDLLCITRYGEHSIAIDRDKIMLLGAVFNNVCVRTKLRDGAFEVTLPEDVFRELLQSAVSTIDVDEEWYIKTYEDVRAAIQSGQVENAKEHFIKYGYTEGRLPRMIFVDEEYYKSQYVDVKNAISAGEISSAQEHFIVAGCYEGRRPHHNFAL